MAEQRSVVMVGGARCGMRTQLEEFLDNLRNTVLESFDSEFTVEVRQKYHSSPLGDDDRTLVGASFVITIGDTGSGGSS